MRVVVILLICLVAVGIIRVAVEKIMPNRDKKFYHAIVRVVWGIMIVVVMLSNYGCSLKQS
ncbi:hypothetical protein [Ruminococcus albus]|uniref:Uncharacterized protein n=1 Tax=Ruminococcus albus TaxID=1264 RepID=A0A1I1LJK4_RUMAL|nr:hypothetical protein [Ruminococcus albus]SFC73377.1 hypothetical protein SAMN02910406_02275 [Ruminococcus albus]